MAFTKETTMEKIAKPAPFGLAGFRVTTALLATTEILSEQLGWNALPIGRLQSAASLSVATALLAAAARAG
jgi:succinate-acetate transporter protein